MKEDLILIGGKAYKKCRVVMLPTNGRQLDFGCHCKDKEHHNHHCGLVESKGKLYLNGDLVELYILSNEEIKEGDWCYLEFYGTIGGLRQEVGKYDTTKSYLTKKKIIATTDKSLKLKEHQNGCNLERCLFHTCDSKCSLSRPSDDFLKAYCKADGKISEVLVEYERETTFGGKEEYYFLKVAPNNTITIKRVELSIEEAAKEYHRKDDSVIDTTIREAFKAGISWRDNNPSGEKMYTKQEVENLVSTAFWAGRGNGTIPLEKAMEVHNEWVETNL